MASTTITDADTGEKHRLVATVGQTLESVGTSEMDKILRIFSGLDIRLSNIADVIAREKRKGRLERANAVIVRCEAEDSLPWDGSALDYLNKVDDVLMVMDEVVEGDEEAQVVLDKAESLLQSAMTKL